MTSNENDEETEFDQVIILAQKQIVKVPYEFSFYLHYSMLVIIYSSIILLKVSLTYLVS